MPAAQPGARLRLGTGKPAAGACVDHLLAAAGVRHPHDRPHQRRVLAFLANTGAQVFVTGTEVPAELVAVAKPTTMFTVLAG